MEKSHGKTSTSVVFYLNFLCLKASKQRTTHVIDLILPGELVHTLPSVTAQTHTAPRRPGTSYKPVRRPGVVLCLWVPSLPGLFGAGLPLTLPSAFPHRRSLLVRFCLTVLLLLVKGQNFKMTNSVISF